MKAQKVQSKTVLVTGCSSGIGEATANYLRGEGWDVFPTARSEFDLEKLRSVGFEALSLDLCDSKSIKDCVSRLLRQCPAGIGAIVNNAGIAIPGAIEDLSREDLKMHIQRSGCLKLHIWVGGSERAIGAAPSQRRSARRPRTLGARAFRIFCEFVGVQTAIADFP